MTFWFPVLAAAIVAAPAAFGQPAPAQPAPQATPQAAANAPAPQAPEPADTGERIKVSGFRSAQWGMTDAQVKAAIKKDFNINADQLKTDDNLAERTTVLTATVPDLLEGAGTARISYIFGFSSKKLIQVNVVWGTAVDPQVSAEKIVAAANQLRQLLADSGYQPGTVVTNTRLGDGSMVVFEGQDADKHTTVLRLATAAVTPRARNGKPEKPVETAALSLSYILDPTNPDIFRLKKGQF